MSGRIVTGRMAPVGQRAAGRYGGTVVCVCVVLHVAVFTGTSATRPVSPHTSSPRFTTLTHCSQSGAASNIRHGD
jgi:hypothetical protein